MSAVVIDLIEPSEAPQSSLPGLLLWYSKVRAETELLCEPLVTDDYNMQSMPDVSPPKWHLAHTTWFFENFLLAPFLPGYAPFNPKFGYLFNSYYQTVGAFQPRLRRALSRPTVAEVYDYREYVDEHMRRLIERREDESWREIETRIELGLHHEQQHQELLLTDLKHIFACNPLRPAYRQPPHRRHEAGWSRAARPVRHQASPAMQFFEYAGGLKQIGHAGPGFAYDNEMPRHPVYVGDYGLGARLVTNGEFLEFIEAGAYRDPRYWLSEGWNAVRERDWTAPLYWERDGGGDIAGDGTSGWQIMTLSGMMTIDHSEPVCHISYFEADAYARWAGFRLPTEAEWELAGNSVPIRGNFRDSGGQLQPQALAAAVAHAPAQMFGDVWEWTQSAYSAYPGYQPPAGALGEYNGKFMCNQLVLRGGSCATPRAHMRTTYRNFFTAADRWQFSGVRLAKNL